MIIFINGAFGSGKSTVAKLLVQKLPGSMLYDPEEVGFALRNILGPIEKHDDFQHYPEWRSLVVEVARQIKEKRNLHLVIPMTVWRAEYFDEVVTGLKNIDEDFHHFCLTASLETIHERLRKRGEQKPGSWPYIQAKSAVPALKDGRFAEHIDTEKLSADEIADQILSPAK